MVARIRLSLDKDAILRDIILEEPLAASEFSLNNLNSHNSNHVNGTTVMETVKEQSPRRMNPLLEEREGLPAEAIVLVRLGEELGVGEASPGARDGLTVEVPLRRRRRVLEQEDVAFRLLAHAQGLLIPILQGDEVPVLQAERRRRLLPAVGVEHEVLEQRQRRWRIVTAEPVNREPHVREADGVLAGAVQQEVGVFGNFKFRPATPSGGVQVGGHVDGEDVRRW